MDPTSSSHSSHAASALEAARSFRSVLAACSPGDSGVRAALRAARLPLAPGARVTLLHVAATTSTRSSAAAAGGGRRALHRLAAAASDAASAAGNRQPAVVPVLAEGSPATEIVRTAWQRAAEIIVVGPPAQRMDGSSRATVFRVIRRADLPVLVARSDPSRAHRNVLCAVDRSVTAVETVALAARFARATEGTLTLLHAYHLPFAPWITSGAQEHEGEAAAHVEALARAVAADVPSVRTLVRKGDPCLEIVRAALEERADLAVLGTRGRTGLSLALVGSGAEWVVANAPFDVLVARPHRHALEPR